MRVLGFAMAGMLALTTPIAARAIPVGSGIEHFVPAPGIVHVSGGCGWGWHPVPGHWSPWRGEWVPPHCAPNHHNKGWGPYGDGQGPYGGWQYYGRGS